MLAQLVAACGGGGADASLPPAPAPGPVPAPAPSPPAPAPLAQRALTFVAGDLAYPDEVFILPTAYDGTGAGARFNGITAMAAAPDGTLYVADTYTVRKIRPDGVVITLAGTTPVLTPAAGLFQRVTAIAVADAGTLYVADRSGLFKITTAGSVTPVPGLSTAMGAPAIRALAMDPEGNLLLLDRADSVPGPTSLGWRIRKRFTDGSMIDLPGGLIDGGTPADPREPQRIAVDAAGNVYVAMLRNPVTECSNRCVFRATAGWVQKISPAGAMTIMAGSQQMSGAADGQGTAALFNAPLDLAVDAEGNLFIADALNQAVRKISPQGLVTTPIGMLPSAPLPDSAAATGAIELGPLPGRLRQPLALALAPGGRLFIAAGLVPGSGWVVLGADRP